MSYGRRSCCNFKRAEELDVSGINVSGRVDLSYFMSDCPLLRKTDVSHFNTEDTTNLSGFFYNCPQLRTFGDISLWKTNNLLYCNDFFGGNQYIESINLSGWETPILKECSNMFSSMILCKVIDISNWTTSQIESVFSLPPYLDYLIMDKEEIKFPNKIFANNSHTKYLVPSNMVNLYKEHANWQSRASQIDSIDNYTITRYDG